jgi:hypothetical protein
MTTSLTRYVHPIMAGFCAFLATIIGSKFFNLESPILLIIVGFALFLLANNGLYKFKFNSYNLNGVTTTTVLIFVTQATCMLIWKGNSVKLTWILGVILITIGVTIL